MRTPRALLGMLISILGLMGSTWAMYRLMHTGTCASGGPYVSAHQCPSGTLLQILALMGGIVAGVAGAGLAGYAVGAMWFGLFFVLGGAAAMVAIGGTGGAVFGGLFIVLLGLPGVVYALRR